MITEFELTIDTKTGLPKIKFTHWDKDNCLEQLALKIFIDTARQKGIRLVNVGGFAEVGKPKLSHEKYEIIINE